MSALIHPDDVLLVQAHFWPGMQLYDKELEIVDATLTCRETVVRAGNGLGKDFTSAFLALSSFIAAAWKGLTARIVTTSVKQDHIGVMWGEIGDLIAKAARPINEVAGGDFIVNDMLIRRRSERALQGTNAKNYLVGLVSMHGEGMAGHHADFTLGIGDEASGIVNKVRDEMQGWCDHMLWISNPRPGFENFYRELCDAGDLVAS